MRIASKSEILKRVGAAAPVIVQILPALVSGGVERGTVETAVAICKHGGRAIVISRGGAMVHQLDRAGIKHYTVDVHTKNPLRWPKIRSQLKDIYASLFLIYDLVQLSALLYLTGGILNPFSFLLIIPTIVSSTFLSMGTTIVLGFFTSILLLLISSFYFPLPGIQENTLIFPVFYKTGILVAILIGLIFLSYFGIRFAGETKKRSEAFNKLQEVISKEYELESLGGQAAAAAHSLGTPLATISVVAKELKKDIGDDAE